jgi:hypothetical protein
MRPRVIDAIAGFVGPQGTLVVITRGRPDDVEPDIMPWPLSRRDLSRFLENGLTETEFEVMDADEEGEPPRFVVQYKRME